MIKLSPSLGHTQHVPSLPLVKGPVAKPATQISLAGKNLGSGAPVLRTGVFGNFASGFRSLLQRFQQRPVAATIAGLSPLLLGAQEAFAAEPQTLTGQQKLAGLFIFGCLTAAGVVLANLLCPKKAKEKSQAPILSLSHGCPTEKVRDFFGTEFILVHCHCQADFLRELRGNRLNSFEDYIAYITYERYDFGTGEFESAYEWYFRAHLPQQGILLGAIDRELVGTRLGRLKEDFGKVAEWYEAAELLDCWNERYEKYKTISDNQQADPDERRRAQAWLHALNFFKAAYGRDVSQSEAKLKHQGASKN